MQQVPASSGERKEGIGTATFVSKRKEGLKLVFAGERNVVIGMAASASKRRGGRGMVVFAGKMEKRLGTTVFEDH